MYAELASLAFRATGRQALTDHTISTQFSSIHRSNTLSRLKLSEDSWQPLLKKKSLPHFGRAKSSGTTVPQQPSPDLPEPIRRYARIMSILIALLCPRRPFFTANSFATRNANFLRTAGRSNSFAMRNANFLRTAGILRKTIRVQPWA